MISRNIAYNIVSPVIKIVLNYYICKCI